MAHNMVQATIEELTITGVIKNADDQILLDYGTATPSAVAGYAKGALFVNATAGTILINIGTATSCSFREGPVITDTTNGKQYTFGSTNGVLELVEV